MRRGSFAASLVSVSLILGGALSATACASVSPAQAGPSKKRGPPPVVAPVSAKGVIYEAVVWGTQRGLDQNGGYVAAKDKATGRELWVAKVYTPPRDPEMEADKQDLFIKSLKLVERGAALLVEDERGGRYRLDLTTRVAAPL